MTRAPDQQARDQQAQDHLTQAAARLPELQEHAAGLKAQVDSGAFRLTPEAAAAAAKVCRDAIAALNHDVLRRTKDLGYANGFGECLEGAALAWKFQDKAAQFRDVVKRSQQVLENMAQCYEASGKRTMQTDEDIRGTFRGVT